MNEEFPTFTTWQGCCTSYYKCRLKIACSVSAMTYGPQHSEGLSSGCSSLDYPRHSPAEFMKRTTDVKRFEEPAALQWYTESQWEHLNSDVFLELLA